MQGGIQHGHTPVFKCPGFKAQQRYCQGEVEVDEGVFQIERRVHLKALDQRL